MKSLFRISNFYQGTAAAFLAGIILLIGLAGVSPDLHQQLHGDNACKHACSHSQDSSTENSKPVPLCAVHLFNEGLTYSIELEIPEYKVTSGIPLATLAWISYTHARTLSKQSRAPPTEKIV